MRHAVPTTTAIWLASQLAAEALGLTFYDRKPGIYWQLLDPQLLETDLWRSLVDLQAQPPLWNLWVGLALKTGHPHEVLFAGALACSWLLLFALVLLMPGRLGVALTTLFALHPIFLVVSHWFFYTLPVALFCVLAVLAVRRGSSAGFAVACGLLMLTRSLFHPLWFVVAGAAPALSLRHRSLLAFPLAAVLLLFAKNEAQVGVFGVGSWLGMNLSIDLDKTLSREQAQGLHRDPQVPRVWFHGPFLSPEVYSREGYFQEPLDPDHPALTQPFKSTGDINFNHRDYVAISRESVRAVRIVAARYPDALARRVQRALERLCTPGIDFIPRRGDLDRAEAALPIANALLFLGTGFWLLLPAALLGGLALGLRRRDPALLFAALTVGWVCAAACAVEPRETNRIRCEIDPLLVFLTHSLAGSLAEAARAKYGRTSAVARDGAVSAPGTKLPRFWTTRS